tara:strand:+ start:451 stop:606 length:156 start_codon:yes stop_codon:yes gene_type:complete
MKLYEVELKSTRYVTYTVEATDENHAEKEAVTMLAGDLYGGDWYTESINEA